MFGLIGRCGVGCSMRMGRIDQESMKLSDPFIRSPSEKPSRIVTEYTPDELSRFREEYRPLVARYRRQGRILGFALVSACLCMFLGMTLPWPFTMYFWATGICSIAFCLFARGGVPNCPGCRKSPDLGLGEFCPNCGSRALERSHGWFSGGPKCRACGLGKGGSRRYRIRACTHCGLGLDDRGLCRGRPR